MNVKSGKWKKEIGKKKNFLILNLGFFVVICDCGWSGEWREKNVYFSSKFYC